jgi:hypothetical protein
VYGFLDWSDSAAAGMNYGSLVVGGIIIYYIVFGLVKLRNKLCKLPERDSESLTVQSSGSEQEMAEV